MNDEELSVIKLFEQLMNTSSSNEKISIISSNKDNKLFVDCLVFLLDTSVVTGISKKKITKSVGALRIINKTPNTLKDMMDYLNKNNTGTNTDIFTCQNFIGSREKEYSWFYVGLFTKSLKLGVTAKSMNKAIPNSIVTFECMLADKYFENPDYVVGKDFTLTTKLDGVRCLCLVHNGIVEFISRQGKKYEGLVDIEKEIIDSGHDNVVFDGELCMTNVEDISSTENYDKTIKIVTANGEKHGVKLVVFDIISYDDFVNKSTTIPYIERRNKLDELAKSMPNKYLHVLESLYIGDDVSKISELLDIERCKNHEGIMININDAPYEFKRTTSLLKVKVMQDADLLVTGVYDGKSKSTKGKLGGITVKFEYGGEYYECNCGSGFTKTDRIVYWQHPELLIGKIVTIQYFEITNNDEGGYGLRFPVFTGRIRADKTEISMH